MSYLGLSRTLGACAPLLSMDPLRVVTMHDFRALAYFCASSLERPPHTDPTDTLRVLYRRPWTTNNGPIPVDYVP